MLLSMEAVNKSFGANVILGDVTLKIEDTDRIGLIGVNGAGKSTLLNVISGDLEHDSGIISRKNGLRVGFLRQNSGLERHNTIASEMRSVFQPLLDAERDMRSLEQKMSSISHSGMEYEQLAAEYAHKQAQYDAGEGYLIDVKVSTVLGGMGFADKDRNTLIDTLSGGEKTRLALCKLLLEAPELLILDEPTNHLDFKTLMWLEEYLVSYKGALLIVSHDRYFLDKLVTDICEVERNRLARYKGNYSKFVALKAERVERQQKEYDMQQAQIEKLQDYVDRNLVRATTSKRAQSKQKAIERIEQVEKPKPPVKPPKMQFTYDREPVKDVLHVGNLTIEVGNPQSPVKLCEGMSLDVMKGEKVAVIGDNGVGKSTFLKIIQNLVPYSRGQIEWGRNVKISYFEQEDVRLHGNKTAIDELWDRFPTSYEHDIRTLLGNVRLTGENVFKPVSKLSGGERAKLKFAIMMCEHGNMLILDEPTNHLDLATKEALDTALTEFEGTIIAVSHDRYLLSKMPTKIVEMKRGQFVTYEGKFPDYLAKRDQINARLASEQARTAAAERTAESKELSESAKGNYRSKKQRSDEVARKRRLTQIENGITELEQQISQLEEKLSTPEIASDYAALTETCATLDSVREELSALYEEWEQIED